MGLPDHVHNEQIQIWAEELVDAITVGGTEFTPKDYEHVIDIQSAAQRAVRYLVSNIYGELKEQSDDT